ncbi:MAG: phosphoribosylaminoimidazolesuccinocarboxamide synthase [Planctomycetota bacterium]
MTKVLLRSELEGFELAHRGKVRDIYALGDRLLIVTTDRISAFDVVLDCGIPNKGRTLTQLSAFWFEKFESLVPNHLITTDPTSLGLDLGSSAVDLEGRTMVVRKGRPFPFEFIIRGYVTGSAWNSYQKTGSVCGIELPKGLPRHGRLERPILTPTTKAAAGHDQDIEPERVAADIGEDAYRRIEAVCLELFEAASAHALERGILIADTKLELAEIDGEITLIDEVLTPDSSRYWPADEYEPGIEAVPSYDKQIMRNFLLSTDWDMTPPAPPIPQDIIDRTSQRYTEIYERLTGQPLKVGS